MQQIRYEPDTKTIQDLVNLYEKKHLNLNPGFQRDSVWTTTDRKTDRFYPSKLSATFNIFI